MSELTNVAERADDMFDLYGENRKNYTFNPFSMEFLNFLTSSGFMTAPASTKYHGAYEGGLYDHSKAVYLRLRDLTKKLNLQWKRPESPFIIGMFHDLCKCDQYIKVEGSLPDESGIVLFGEGIHHFEYNPNTELKGHGSKSVILLEKFIPLTEEERLCIRYHMGPYETSDWKEFDEAIRKYETVFWTHAADMMASKVDGT